MKLTMIITLCVLSACTTTASNAVQLDDVMNDAFRYWELFRDPSNGLWCDSIGLNTGSARCKFGSAIYSSAGTGMGIVSDCVRAELGLSSKGAAKQRVLQTLDSILHSWPREAKHGFFVHFFDGLKPRSEYSTIDTAEMTAGALFASNYFGEDIVVRAEKLFALTDWQQAIDSASDPTMRTVVNPASGRLSGVLKPFNEYYIVAYLAKRQKKRQGFQVSRDFLWDHRQAGWSSGLPQSLQLLGL